MTLSRDRLYALVLIACLAGYCWLFYNTKYYSISFDSCLLKRILQIPCPSCGTTRSILALLQGNLSAALYINPLGIIVALIMVIAPLWIAADLARKGDTFYVFVQGIENQFKNVRVALPAVLFILLNWIWNIVKGL